MHDLAFADATRPTPAVILRLSMRPYSIGHELILFHRRNPLVIFSDEEFAKLPAVHQRRAVIECALVCCQSWKRNNRPHRWLKLWEWSNRKSDFPLAIAEFRNYRAAGSSYPPRATFPPDEDKGSRSLGQPTLAWLYNFVSRLPAPEIQLWGELAWDFPLGLAAWLNASALEIEGMVKIENDFEHQARTEYEKHLADFEAEQRATKKSQTDQPAAKKESE